MQRAAARNSDNWQDRVCAGVADRMAGRSDLDIRRYLPDLGSAPIPRDPDARWRAVSEAAATTLDRHVRHGDNAHLPPDYGHAARVQAAVSPSGRIVIPSTFGADLQRDTRQVADATRAFVAASFATDSKRYPGEDAAIARARAGLDPAARVVMHAAQVSARLDIDAIRGKGVRMPDILPRGLDAGTRQRLLDEQIAKIDQPWTTGSPAARQASVETAPSVAKADLSGARVAAFAQQGRNVGR